LGIFVCILGFYNRNGFIRGLNPENPPCIPTCSVEFVFFVWFIHVQRSYSNGLALETERERPTDIQREGGGRERHLRIYRGMLRHAEKKLEEREREEKGHYPIVVFSSVYLVRVADCYLHFI